MRVLVLVGRAADVSGVEPTLRLLGGRGHEAHVVADPRDVGTGGAALERICHEAPRVRWTPPPPLPFDRWSFLGRELRRSAAYLRQPGTRGEAPELARAALRGPIASSAAGLWLLERMLRWCCRAIPRDAAVEAFLRAQGPDLVLAVPPIEPGSLQEEHLQRARALGMPVLAVEAADGESAAAEVVAAIEAASARSGRRERSPWWAPVLRPALARVADRLARTTKAREEKAVRQEQLRERRHADSAARCAAWRAAKARKQAERARRISEEEARLAAERRAQEQTAALAYQHYCRVRHWVGRVCDMHESGAIPLSDREHEMLAALAHLSDATPAAIAQLRRCGEALGGARASDYVAPVDALTRRIRYWMGGRGSGVRPDLRVQEPRALGGFGYDMRGELYNEDTLRFFTVLVALQDGALLAEFRSAAQRRLVWEIGGGWGGFAYQFKTVCPNVTYLITGIPEVLLVSAVYLMALFPTARCRFYDESSGDGLWDDWESVDFVFVPETALPGLQPPPIDLTLDIMTLVHMRPERVCTHIQRSFDRGSRYMYSLLPRRAKPRESAMVWQAVNRLYWPQPVPARDDPDPGLPSNAAAVGNIEYVHLVGWRRIRA